MAVFGGRWETVGERLGEGGAGEVYRVKDLTNPEGPHLALKRLKNTRADRLARFRTEVAALRRLDHPNVLKIVADELEPENERERPFFVTELAEGGSLADLPVMEMDPVQLLHLFLQICEGIRELHRSQGVHRDIKPDNILLRGDGSAMVGDFGIAYLFDEVRNGRATATFEQVGSRFFICPENEEGRVTPTPACDIFSLGKLLYWMMSGGEMISRTSHRAADFDIVTRRRNYWVEHVNLIIDDMLQVDPGRRPATVSSVIERVTEAIHLIEGRYNPLSRRDQGCRYCGKGTYKLVPQSVYHFYGIDQRNLHTQRLLQCQHCGHVEFFFISGEVEAKDWLKEIGLAEF
jgi:serine/threonine protein kinase